MNTKQLIDQLIQRLNYYREEQAIMAHVPSRYELEKRIQKLEKQLEILQKLPLEQQSEIDNEELETLLGSLPLDFNKFDWREFNNASQIVILHCENMFVTNNITTNSVDVKGNNNVVSVGNVNSPITVTQHIEREKKINSVLTKLPYNEAFEGRKKELAELKEQITTHKSISVISINGIGGIGKSALSKAFFLENYKEYNFVLFLEGKSTIYDTFNDYTLLDNLDIAEKINSIPYQTPNRNEIVFGIIKNTLSNLEGKKLLLIDDASENTHLLKDLIQSNWEILTTSRQKIDFMFSFELLQATPNDAIAIFCVYYGKAIETLSQEEKAQIQRLVNRLALHPLAIELVAKNAKLLDWTFEEINQKLAEKGLNIDEDTNLVTTHSQKEITDIFKYLLELFPLDSLKEEELKLLTIYSVLPNLPITKQTWKILLGESEDHWQKLCVKLNKRGLINQNEKAFEIHALLAEIVRYKNEERLDEDCEKVIYRLIQELHPKENIFYHNENYKNTFKYILYSENMIFHIQNTYQKGELYYMIGDFYEQTGNLIKSLKAYKCSKQVYEKLTLEQPINLAVKEGLSVSYSRLGKIYQELGNLEFALSFFKKNRKLLEQLCKDSPENVSFKNGLSISYSDLGELHQNSGNLQLSLSFFYNDLLLQQQLYRDFPQNTVFKNGLVISYLKSARIHKKLDKLKIAFEFATKGNTLAEQLYIAFPQSVIYKDVLATSYEELGEIHQKLGNLHIALQIFEKRRELVEQLFMEFDKNVSFKNGLAIAYSKLGIIYQKLGNKKLALELFQKFNILIEQVYNEFPQNVNYKNGLAVSYIYLGQVKEEINISSEYKKHYSKAKILYGELVSNFPLHIDFQTNLTWVEDKLNQLQ